MFSILPSMCSSVNAHFNTSNTTCRTKQYCRDPTEMESITMVVSDTVGALKDFPGVQNHSRGVILCLYNTCK